MTLEQLLLALKARYRIVLVAALVTVCVALAVSLTTPKTYIATSAVVVDVKSADPIAGSILPALTQPSYMATQLDIIQSDRVASRVVTMLKMDQGDDVKAAWLKATDGKGTLVSWLAGGLRGALDAKPARDSNVIAISYKGRDPKVSADVANAFAQAFIDTSVELRTEPARRYLGYFDKQAQAARDRLEKAQTALSKFQRDNGIIVASDERYDVESARLSELSSQLSAIQGQKADSQSRVNQVKDSTASLQEVLQSPLVQSLKSEVARQEAKVQQMNQTLGPNNPAMQQAQAELRSLRSRLGGETQQIANGVATNNRVNVQRESDLKAAVEAQKVRLLKLKQDRDSAAVLQRDVDGAKSAFDAVSQRQTQSNLESQSNQTNIAILNPAIEPSKAAGPRIGVNLAIALLAGLLLGTGAALLMEQMDRRVRSMTDLSRALGLPVIGALGGPAPQDTLIARLSGRPSRKPRLGFRGPLLGS